MKTVGPTAGDEELRAWLENHMKTHPHLTATVLARTDHIGAGSRTLVDSYVQGTYFLDKKLGGQGVLPERSKIERLVRAYREKVEGTERHGYVNTFLETRTWRQMLSAWEVAVREKVIVVAYGKPGVGKSRCLMELSVRKMTTMPITILCSRNVTVGYFVQRLAQETGLTDKGTIPRLEDLIAAKLQRNPRPLIVDQANFLNEKSLGTVCHIWEKARIPAMLIGTKDLFELFTRSNATEDVRAQISSRVAMHYPLAELSAGECKAILKRALGDDATDETIARIYQITGGIHRHVDMIVPRIAQFKARKDIAEKLSNGQITMDELIDNAGRRLMVG